MIKINNILRQLKIFLKDIRILKYGQKKGNGMCHAVGVGQSELFSFSFFFFEPVLIPNDQWRGKRRERRLKIDVSIKILNN